MSAIGSVGRFSEMPLRTPSIRRAFAAHARLYTASYLGAVGLCALMLTLGVYGRSGDVLFHFSDVNLRSFVGHWRGSMTLVSGGLLSLGGALVLVAGVRDVRRGVRRGLAWCFAGLGGIVLALDEVFMWHEHWTEVAQSIGIPRLFGVIDQDVYIFGVYGLAALLTFLALREDILGDETALFPLLAAAAFFVSSELIDFVPWHSLSPEAKQILGPAEETAKTLGSLSWFLYAVLRRGRSAQVRTPSRAETSTR